VPPSLSVWFKITHIIQTISNIEHSFKKKIFFLFENFQVQLNCNLVFRTSEYNKIEITLWKKLILHFFKHFLLLVIFTLTSFLFPTQFIYITLALTIE